MEELGHVDKGIAPHAFKDDVSTLWKSNAGDSWDVHWEFPLSSDCIPSELQGTSDKQRSKSMYEFRHSGAESFLSLPPHVKLFSALIAPQIESLSFLSPILPLPFFKQLT